MVQKWCKFFVPLKRRISNLYSLMATHYLYLDDRNKAAKRWPLKIIIDHQGKKAPIKTGFKLTHDEWDDKARKVKPPFPNATRTNAQIERKTAIVGDVIVLLEPHLHQLTAIQIRDAAQKKIDEELSGKVEKEAPEILRSAIDSESAQTCFYKYAAKVAERFYLNDQGGSARTIEETVDSLKAYTQKDRLPFRQITVDFIKAYEVWYLGRFNRKGEQNTINGFNFRAKEIRRVFNLAIDDKATEVSAEIYPFGRGGYGIRTERTGNKKKEAADIAKTLSLELTEGTKLDHHLNYFKFYFECWGMNFMDVAYLRVYQVKGGRLKYTRRKTKWADKAKKFDIELSDTAQEIVDLYTQGKKSTDFVFPIIDDVYYLNETLTDKAREAENKKLFEKKLSQRRANHIRRLKTIARRAGIEGDLTSYMARHSFFSIALKSGVEKSVISEMAGHADFKITENYLAGFDDETLAANADKVRDAVRKSLNAKHS